VWDASPGDEAMCKGKLDAACASTWWTIALRAGEREGGRSVREPGALWGGWMD